jgi:hypothetical protein
LPEVSFLPLPADSEVGCPMTEAEWLSSCDPGALLSWARDVARNYPEHTGIPNGSQFSDRKIRLFNVACCRYFWEELSLSHREAVEVGEGFADGERTWEERAGARNRMMDTLDRLATTPSRLTPPGNERKIGLVTMVEGAVRYQTPDLFNVRRNPCPVPVQASLLRCVFGDPFRYVGVERTCFSCYGTGLDRPAEVGFPHPVHTKRRPCPNCRGLGNLYGPDPRWLSWREGTVPKLARLAYEERLPDGFLDPEKLLVLADGAEEAGCPDVYLLNHLRGLDPCGWCLVGSHGNEQACGGRGYGKHPRGFHGWVKRGRVVCSQCGGSSIGKLIRCPTCENRGSVPVQHVRGCWAVDFWLGLS